MGDPDTVRTEPDARVDVGPSPGDGRPNPSAAPVCRVRLRYAKRGKLRFASHRDLARVFERAVRKAGVPVAYSQGFSPHPKLSWIGAAPTGTASEAEYVELALTETVEPAEVARRLNTALPADTPVLDAATAGPGALADRMQASHWRITVPGVGVADLERAAAALRAAGEALVPRRTKSGVQDIDVRARLVSLAVSEPSSDESAQVAAGVAGSSAAEGTADPGSCGILDVVVRQASPTVRPDDVLSALRVVADLEWSGVPARAVRTAQGRLDDGGRVVDPLA